MEQTPVARKWQLGYRVAVGGLLAIAVLLGATVLLTSPLATEALEGAAIPQDANFRAIAMRGGTPNVAGDSLEGFRAAASRATRFVEADFVVTGEGILIAGHADDLGGTCGSAIAHTLAELGGCRLPGGQHLATLQQLLRFSFAEVYIDLKAPGDAPAFAAIDEIVAADRLRSAVLLLYQPSDKVARQVAVAGVRAGVKGYPESAAGVRHLIDRASALQFAYACSEARWLTPELVRYAKSRGVELVPWDLSGNWRHLRTLIEGGIAGLIVTDVANLEGHLVRQ